MDQPQQTTVTQEFEIQEEKIRLTINLLGFSNGYVVYIYDIKPKLGSLSVGFPVEKQNERLQLFSGNQGELADTISLILSKKFQSLVYCSVNITTPELADRGVIANLLEKLETTPV